MHFRTHHHIPFLLFSVLERVKRRAREMARYEIVGEYKRCKKKGGLSYLFDKESKALVQCDTVSNCFSVKG